MKSDCADGGSVYAYEMSSSFHSADKSTHRKVMLVGLLFCGLFVAISFFAREQPESTYVLQKADKLVRTARSGAATTTVVARRHE